MKKLFLPLCFLLPAVCFGGAALAEKNVPVDGLAITVPVPDGWLWFDRSLAEGDTAPALPGLTGEDALALLESAPFGDGVFCALSPDGQRRLLLSTVEWNLSGWEPELILQDSLAGKMCYYLDRGGDILSSDLSNGESRYRFIASGPGGEGRICVYNTLVDGTEYTVTLTDPDAGREKEDDGIAYGFARGIVFESPAPVRDSFDSRPDPAGDLREYTVPEGPLTVVLDEARFSVLTPGMPGTEQAYTLDGFDAEAYEARYGFEVKSLWIRDRSDEPPVSFEITIALRDRKCPGVDVRSFSLSAEETLRESFALYNLDGNAMKTLWVNEVPYLRLILYHGTVVQYMTIINGDMICVCAESTLGEVKEKQEEMLLEVLTGITYPD